MVAGLIGIWFVVAVVFYVLKAARAVLPCIPKALGVLLCLPAMPFAVAYKNRETHPWQARCIVIGWSLRQSKRESKELKEMEKHFEQS